MGNKYGYYKSETRGSQHSGERRPGGGLLLWVLDLIVLIITFVAVAALFLALFAKWISPESASLFAFLGLFYPIIYVANCLCALWWVARWRKWFFVPLAVLILGFGNMKLFYRPDWRKEYAEPSRSRDEIVITTYNVMNFSGPNIDADTKCSDAIVDFLNSRRSGIICLQEAYFSHSFDLQQLKERLKTINYSVWANASSDGGDHGSGLAILSTYPIIRSGRTLIDDDAVRSLWADIKIGRDTLRVVCNHLQSTAIDSEDMHTTLTPQIIDDEFAREKIMTVMRKMARNYRLRAVQAEQLDEFISSSPYRIIVCGDFNDTPASYAYHKIADDMTDAFVECGRGAEHTFKGFWNLFRIDYVLLSDGLTAKHYDSFDLAASDHRPIEVGFEIETQTSEQ